MENKKEPSENDLILFMFTIVFGLYTILVADMLNKTSHKETIMTYEITGHYNEPPGYKTRAKRYLFLHNEIGDFTIEVSPRTYVDAVNGQKEMSFKESYLERYNNADNEPTKERLKEHMLKEHKMQSITFNMFTIMFGPIIIIFGYFILLIIYSLMYINRDRDMSLSMLFITAIFLIMSLFTWLK